MHPKTRISLLNLGEWNYSAVRKFNSMIRQLRNGCELPPGYDDLHAAVLNCEAALENLSNKIEEAYENDKLTILQSVDLPLTEPEIVQLRVLNLRLVDITRHLGSVAKDVTPRLEAKLADPADPMYDYEIEVRIDYILREDDPEYDEEEDNFLATRTESLKNLYFLDENYYKGIGSDGLRAESQCWLFHDLHDHEYGRESPRIPPRDCLRIGKIYVDVQVWQQYDFDVSETEFVVPEKGRF
jgi:hypothetical protein